MEVHQEEHKGNNKYKEVLVDLVEVQEKIDIQDHRQIDQ